jgi:hypothetical protein
VGDSIAGQGGIKNGVFVPTQLGVIDPATMGQRRRRGAEGAASPGATAPSGVASPKSPATPVTPPAVPQ